jgi:hypothetical protein
MWMVAVDITTTIPDEQFRLMRDQMFPEVVLSRVRSRDEVHVMPVDSDPERHVHVLRLIRNVGLDKELAALLRTVQAHIVHTTNPRIMTNLGGVLAYAKRLGITLQEERARFQATGKASPPTPRIVVMVFTDGKLAGRQTMPLPGVWPLEVEVWFWGVEPSAEGPLKQWATTTMGLPEGQFHIVRLSGWQTVATQVFGRQIDRPHPNLEILKRLNAHQTVARR